ncbi:MAG: MotA/TolQ/ExbB proton channel family protein [Spirochaetes bacterium]|nr:MotA/TolQ/ExbB proton channel family protein [Spirochaetota bacterium]
MNIEVILIFLRGIPTWAVIIPLLFCSVLLLAVAIERIVFFHRIDIDYSAVVSANDFPINPVTEIIIRSKQFREKNSSGYSNIIILYSEKAVRQMEKFIGTVSTIATVAPMIGLLGTVTGFMKSFNALASQNSTSGLLASGITEALLTTALGLLVAIPAIVFHNYLVSKSAFFIKEIEYVANFLSEEGK